MKQKIRKFFKKLLCRHKGDKRFIANIHGDAIRLHGYNRSIWQCKHCEDTVMEKKLHIPEC